MTTVGTLPVWGSRGGAVGMLLMHAAVIILTHGAGLPAADDVVVGELGQRPAAEFVDPPGGLRAIVVMGNQRMLGHNKRVALPDGAILAPPTLELGSLFDRIVFGPESRMSHPAEDVFAQIRQHGERRIELLADVCRLSADQRRALRLALASDVNGFTTHLASARSRYAGIEMSVRPGSLDRELVVALRADAIACRSQWQQFFGPASLLASTMPRVLEPEQAERLAAWVTLRRAERWRAMLEAVLLRDGSDTLWQSDAAAAEALAVLTADVPPLAVFAAACDPAIDARMTKLQRSLVMVRLGRIPEPTLRPLIQPANWGRVQHEIDRAEEPGVGHVERQLTMRQVLEESQP